MEFVISFSVVQIWEPNQICPVYLLCYWFICASHCKSYTTTTSWECARSLKAIKIILIYEHYHWIDESIKTSTFDAWWLIKKTGPSGHSFHFRFFTNKLLAFWKKFFYLFIYFLPFLSLRFVFFFFFVPFYKFIFDHFVDVDACGKWIRKRAQPAQFGIIIISDILMKKKET